MSQDKLDFIIFAGFSICFFIAVISFCLMITEPETYYVIPDNKIVITPASESVALPAW